MVNLIFLAGSASKNSLNKKLAKAASEIAKEKGAIVNFIDLADYQMPLYCTDEEAENGLPENAKKLKKLFQNCDGFFIASPEYNSTYSALLKNMIDWLSRPHEKDEGFLSAYSGKVVAIAAASPGPLGGLRGLTPLRMLLSNLSIHVIPTQVAIGGKDTLSDDSKLTQESHIKMMHALIDEFIKTATAMKNA